jgi:uncharacterized protein YjiS (DUF1127 family)
MGGSESAAMADDSDPPGHDLRRLTPLQWTALKQGIIRNAQIERGRMICSAVGAVIAAFTAGWRNVRKRQQARAALQAMRDIELRDVGVTRAGIETAIRRSDTAMQGALQSKESHLENHHVESLLDRPRLGA